MRDKERRELKARINHLEMNNEIVLVWLTDAMNQADQGKVTIDPAVANLMADMLRYGTTP